MADMRRRLLTGSIWITGAKLVTNGLGGYASGTVVGALTRRFHGLLIAAFPSPLGRTMLLTHLEERLTFRDGSQDNGVPVEAAVDRIVDAVQRRVQV